MHTDKTCETCSPRPGRGASIRIVLTILIICSCSSHIFAQEVRSINCDSIQTFCYPEECTGEYGNNIEYIVTYSVEDSGKGVYVYFGSFDTEQDLDHLEIFDGPDTHAVLIGIYSGNELSDSYIFSTGQSLTFKFTSNGSVTGPGWTANLNCFDLLSCGAGDRTYYYLDTSQVLIVGTADPELVLRSSFYFHLSEQDTVLIIDGYNEDAPLLNVLSDSSGYFSLLTSGNYLKVKSMINTDGSFVDFFLSCISHRPTEIIGCTDPDQSICYPEECTGNYPANTSYIQTYQSSDTGSILKLEFNRFSIDFNDDLLIYDGDSVTAPLIGWFFGNENSGYIPTGAIYSSNQYLTFEFRSNSTLNDLGWEANFSCHEKSTVIQVDHGESKELCYPAGCSGDYPDNDEYTVVYNAPDQQSIITAYFESFDTEENLDFLEIFDGYGVEAPLIGSYSGSELNDTTILSTGQYLTFRFISNGSVTGEGWNTTIGCSYSIDCEKGSTRYSLYESTTISFATADPGKDVYATMNLDLGNQDTLFIYDGNSGEGDLISYLTDTLIYDFRITTTGQFITFRLKEVSSGTYVRIYLNCIPSASTIIIDCTQPVNSVCYPAGCTGNYPDNTRFIQTYQSSDTNSVLKLDFSRFSTEYYDYLAIYDGQSVSAPLIDYYYGDTSHWYHNTPSEVIYSIGQGLTFDFRSNDSLSSTGWEADFSCHVKYPVIQVNNADSREFCYPLGCEGDYPNNDEYVIVLKKEDASSVLSIDFEYFDTEPDIDFLEIYDGYGIEGTFIGSFSGTELSDTTIVSESQFYTFRFTSNESITGKGWKANIGSTQVIDCNDDYNYHYLNPGMKRSYASSDPGSELYAELDMKIQDQDTLFIYDDISDHNTWSAFITDTILNHYKYSATGRYITFKLKSNSYGSYVDIFFSCISHLPEITIECTEQDTRICYPPSCSGNYQENIHFIQTYKTSGVNSILELDFVRFATEYYFDRLSIYDGQSTSYPLMGEFHGSGTSEYDVLPDVIYSSSEYLTFEFKSETGFNRGWDARLTCLDKLTTQFIDHGESHEFCYPAGCTGDYNNNDDYIIVYQAFDPTSIINAYFESFVTEQDSDYLEIFDGYGTGGPLIGRFSGAELSDTAISSTGHCLTFRFTSNGSITGDGWKAHINCYQKFNCGKDYEFVMANRYRKGSYFTSDKGSVIAGRCRINIWQGDTLLIHDGIYDTDPVISVLTDTFSNFYFLETTGQSVYYDLKNVSAGSWVEMWLMCASGKPDKVIDCDAASTDFCYPVNCTDNYPENTIFIQTYRSSLANSVLKLNFDRFATEAYDQMVPDFLNIYDGESVRAPLIGTYYGTQGDEFRNLPDQIVSSDQSVTFAFQSINTYTDPDKGWKVNFTCQDSLLTHTINHGETRKFCYPGDCTGEYSNNDEYLVVYKAKDDNSGISIDFESFNLEYQRDFLEIYEGYGTDGTPLGIFTGTELDHKTIYSEGQFLTFKFLSNGSVTRTGWKIDVRCFEFINCGQEDPDNLYLSSFNTKSFRTSDTLKILTANFQLSLGWEDTLYIYSGIATDDPSLIFTESDNCSVNLAGNALTFRASSDNVWLYGDIKCTYPPNNIDCSNYGTRICYPENCIGLYPTYDEFVKVYKTSEPGSRIKLRFDRLSLGSGDTLWIYDGFVAESVSAPLKNVYYGPDNLTDSLISELVVSSGQFLTLKFKSDNLPSSTGWSAILNCFDTLATNEGDSLALIALYDNTNGPEWRITWDTTKQVYLWDGIWLNSGRVFRIDLSGNNLTGELPAEMGDLIKVDYVDLSGNAINGNIPNTIGNMSELAYLDLSNNSINGIIPGEIGKLDLLSHLDFSENQISGLPQESSGMPHYLKYLNLSSNNLSGEIPENFSTLRFLEKLDLRSNQLSGNLPLLFSLHLKDLDLSHNKFESRFSHQQIISNKIEKILINDNLFTEIDLSEDQTRIQTFDVSNNLLNFGQIRKYIGSDTAFAFYYHPQKETMTTGEYDLGDSVSLSHQFGGLTNLTSYTWRKNGEQLPASGEIYTLHDMTFSDAGTYTCEATNSEIDKLTLIHRFGVKINPEKPVVETPIPYCVGDNIITLSESGNGGEYTVWYHDRNLSDTLGIGEMIRFTPEDDIDTVFAVNYAGDLSSETEEVVIVLRPKISVAGSALSVASHERAVYKWYYNGTLLEESSSSISLRGDGYYHVSILINGCRSSSRQLEIKDGEPVGYSDLIASPGIVLYPNPSDGIVYINSGSGVLTGDEAAIYDLTGKKLNLVRLTETGQHDVRILDIRVLDPGIYFIKFRTKDQQLVRKVIKK